MERVMDARQIEDGMTPPTKTSHEAAVLEALPNFRRQDDYLLSGGASVMSENCHEIIHVDTLRKIIATLRAELTRPVAGVGDAKLLDVLIDAEFALSFATPRGVQGVHEAFPKTLRRVREAIAASRVTAPAGVAGGVDASRDEAIKDAWALSLAAVRPRSRGSDAEREIVVQMFDTATREPGSSHLAVAESGVVQTPLTDAQIADLYHASPETADGWKDYARAIEAAHGIAPTTAKDEK